MIILLHLGRVGSSLLVGQSSKVLIAGRKKEQLSSSLKVEKEGNAI